MASDTQEIEDAEFEPIPIRRIPRRNRSIQLVAMDDQVRQLLANCRRPDCEECKDGIEEARGQRLIICCCAVGAYEQAVEFLKEEQRRRKAGLPLRQGKMENGKMIVNEQPPEEMPPGRVTI